MLMLDKGIENLIRYTENNGKQVEILELKYTTSEI